MDRRKVVAFSRVCRVALVCGFSSALGLLSVFLIVRLFIDQPQAGELMDNAALMLGLATACAALLALLDWLAPIRAGD